MTAFSNMPRGIKTEMYLAGRERTVLTGSLPMKVGVKGDIVCIRIRSEPSPPRLLSEY